MASPPSSLGLFARLPDELLIGRILPQAVGAAQVLVGPRSHHDAFLPGFSRASRATRAKAVACSGHLVRRFSVECERLASARWTAADTDAAAPTGADEDYLVLPQSVFAAAQRFAHQAARSADAAWLAGAARSARSGAQQGGLERAVNKVRRATWTNAVALNLSDLHLGSLPDSLWQCSNLRRLTARSNAFWQPLELPALPLLEQLDLSRSYLSALGALPAGAALTQVNLSHNRLLAVPSQLRFCSQLRELNLADNHLPTLGEDLWHLPLRSLDVSANLLVELPAALCGLADLETLCLSDNGLLRALPAALGRLRSLRELQAAHCRLGALPPSFAELVALETCILSRNALRDLPALSHHHAALKVLDVGYNALRYVPPGLRHMPRLACLILRDNELTAFAVAPGEYPALRWLNLVYNQVDHLPPFFRLGRSLLALFYGNPMATFLLHSERHRLDGRMDFIARNHLLDDDQPRAKRALVVI